MAANDNETEPQLDALYEAAKDYVLRVERCSTSDLQRTFQIGFNRAHAIVERLQAEGVVSPPQDHPA